MHQQLMIKLNVFKQTAILTLIALFTFLYKSYSK